MSCGPFDPRDLALPAEPERRPPPFLEGAPAYHERLRQRVATHVPDSACLSRSRRTPTCDRLPPAATAGLHNVQVA